MFTLEKRSEHCRFTMTSDDLPLTERTADDAKWSTTISGFPPLRLQHYVKENRYNQTTGGMIITIIGERLLFLSVKNAAVTFKNNRLNE